ncbi:MAG TPA: hypothetical protein VG204_12120 [Terriglobia bacterium]|nr:hypothetical protein [Terriglobia bacterium]
MHFVIIDIDKERSADQQRLVKEYYRGYIPHVVVLDGSGRAVYNESGEVSESRISGALDNLFKQPSR